MQILQIMTLFTKFANSAIIYQKLTRKPEIIKKNQKF